jgi:hypothetical protein
LAGYTDPTKGGKKSVIIVINNTIAKVAAYCYTSHIPFGKIQPFLPNSLGGESLCLRNLL